MNSIGVNGDSSTQNCASRSCLGLEPVAERAVADLVVVLVEHDELLGRAVRSGRSEALAAERRVAAVVHERAVERLGELRDPAELRVVALALVADERAHGVVEVVGPLRVAAPARPASAGG